ncbi:MAG: glycine/betaine ABC transporter ATP-binding protein, partial [Paenisporosarcina sp.]
LKIADHMIVLRAGKVEQMGSSQELIHEPANDFVRDFIGQDRINRQRSFGQRKISELSSYFKQAKIGEQVVSINSSEDVEQAIALLEQPHTDVLAIYTNEEFVGYIDQSSILKAVLAKEVGASSYD